MIPISLTRRESWPTCMRPRRLWRFASRLWAPSPFPMDIRWSWARAGGQGEGFNPKARLLQMCRSRDADGEPYYRLDGKKLYFRPEFPVKEEELIGGIELVLRETYLAFDLETEPVVARRGDVVFDLGANVGSNAMVFAERVGPSGKVFAFEPVMRRPLEKNLQVNGFSNVTVVPAAVGDRIGKTQIKVRANCIDSRIADAVKGDNIQAETPAQPLAEGDAEGSAADGDSVGDGISHTQVTCLDVDLMTIDAFVEEQKLERVDLIKVDIEGAEELAMRGAEQTVRRFRPKWTISSYHTDREGQKQHPKLVKLLKEWNYTVREIDGRRIMAW